MLLPILAVALSAAPLQEKKPPEFRTEVRMIRLDVSVLDKSGRPVAGLLQGDFKVAEDGRPVEVSFFEAVEARAEETQASLPAGGEAPPSRRILLLVDTGSMTAGQLLRSRASAARYLDESTAEGDWVRLVNLATRRFWDGRIPEDRARLVAAARALGTRGSAWAMSPVDGADADAGAIEDRFEVEAQGSSASAAETSSRFLSVFARAADLLGTLEGLLVELQGVGGRKGLVLISAGFPQLRDLDRRLQRVASLAREAATVVYFVDAAGLDGLLPERGEPAKPAFETAWARSAGAQDLAEATGGFTSRFANSLTPALARVSKEMRTYYLIGYVPAKPDDGHFRSVKVGVHVPGLTARTKKGYLAGRSR